MEGEDSTLQKSVAIHRLISELKSLAETNRDLYAAYCTAKQTAREGRFVCRRMTRLAKKTEKYAKKITELLGGCGPDELRRLDEEISALEHRLSKRHLVLEFQEQIRRKSTR